MRGDIHCTSGNGGSSYADSPDKGPDPRARQRFAGFFKYFVFQESRRGWVRYTLRRYTGAIPGGGHFPGRRLRPNPELELQLSRQRGLAMNRAEAARFRRSQTSPWCVSATRGESGGFGYPDFVSPDGLGYAWRWLVRIVENVRTWPVAFLGDLVWCPG